MKTSMLMIVSGMKNKTSAPLCVASAAAVDTPQMMQDESANKQIRKRFISAPP